MEELNKIKLLVEKISVDTYKVYNKNNFTAGVRARKNTQELKRLLVEYRKEILKKIKTLKKERNDK